MIYNINQLQAMRLANAAWQEVDTTSIRNCWQKAGILPKRNPSSPATNPSIPVSSLLFDEPSTSQMASDPVSQAEKEVQLALDDLVSTGALQKRNRMDLESLLNPSGEAQVLVETSDHEIFNAVMETAKARETIDITGCDNSDNNIEDDDTPHKPRPTRREALIAASTIAEYIIEWNDPQARKMEAMLAAFNRQLRVEETKGLKETRLTDFYQYT